MARIKPVAISEEIRTSLKDTTFPTLELASIPTGKDIRRLQLTDLFPMATVEFVSSVQRPVGMNKAMEGIYGLSIYIAFLYESGADPNLQKLTYSEEVWDFICDNHEGQNYKLFIVADGGELPSIDYKPQEEMEYLRSNIPIAVFKISLAVREGVTYQL